MVGGWYWGLGTVKYRSYPFMLGSNDRCEDMVWGLGKGSLLMHGTE